MMKREQAMQLADQALDELEEALAAGKSESLKRLLDVMGRFHNYSFGNCMLIALQMPTATYVAGFRRWLELGRYVRKGETGIGIIAPMSFRNRNLDTITNEDEGASVRGFRVVHVFDVSQTDGEPLPSLANMAGDPGDLLPRLECLIGASGIVLKEEELPLGTDGVSRKGEIAVATRLAAADRFAVLVHELAHEQLHDHIQRQQLTKTVRETEAEAVAYVVCRAFGLDCSTRSADYIRLYDGTQETLTKSLSRVQETATQIIASLGVDSAEEGARHVA